MSCVLQTAHGPLDLEEASLVGRVSSYYEQALAHYILIRCKRLYHWMSGPVENRLRTLIGALVAALPNPEDLAETLRTVRECDALLGDILRSGNSAESEHALLDLCTSLAPLREEIAAAISQRDILVPAHRVVHFGCVGRSVVTREDLPMSAILEAMEAPGNRIGSNVETVLHEYSILGTRLAPATKQPSSVGGEFRLVEKPECIDRAALTRLRDTVDLLSVLDSGLGLSYGAIMSLVTVVPRAPEHRQAGSVSGLPGWCWQDADNDPEPQRECAHLLVQLVHEYFHSRLNLIERFIPLFEGNGQSPLLWSPWKQTLRPARQVLHALFTFTAGVHVWQRALEQSILTGEAIRAQCDAYVQTHSGYAWDVGPRLLKGSALSSDGKDLVRGILERLRTARPERAPSASVAVVAPQSRPVLQG